MRNSPLLRMNVRFSPKIFVLNDISGRQRNEVPKVKGIEHYLYLSNIFVFTVKCYFDIFKVMKDIAI
ncbi:hypothetical protein DI44_04230 [Geobacillus sp. CAMR5420]|nr:hypothetical protein DI44_04230 [Geobacillus sp. CAMR5420]PJW16857.1 hypothetical protein CV944_12105 [Geobacillus sp. WSUCF-018B]